MRFVKKKKLSPIEKEVPWGVEYRLRMLHMPDEVGECTGCASLWVECPTLEIMDEHWGSNPGKGEE